MKFVYVSSTYPLFLGMYLELFEGQDVHFFFSRKQYIKVFREIGLKATYLDSFTVKDFLLRRKSVLKKVTEVNNQIGDNELVFTHTQFSIFLFILLSNRKDRRNLFYNFEPIVDNKYSLWDIVTSFKSFIKTALVRISLSYSYNAPNIVKYFAGVFFNALDVSQLIQDYGINSVDPPFSFEELQYRVIDRVQLKDLRIKNLYISQNEMSEKGTLYDKGDVEELEKLIKELSCHVKPHPTGHTFPYSDNIIESFIPSEMYFSNISNAILSINSTTLISASNYYYEKKIDTKVICLMKIVRLLDEQTEQDMYNRFAQRAKQNILFPNTIEELRNILQ